MRVNLGTSAYRRTTGRRRYSRRGFKGAGRLRTVSTKRNFFNSITRPIYSPLPSQFRVALRLVQSFEYGIEANATAYQLIDCFSPIGIGNARPEGFLDLHRLYAKSIVDMIQVKMTYQTHTTNLTVNSAPYFSAEVLGCVISGNDGPADIAAAQALFDRYSSLPEAQIKTLGLPNSGHDIQSLYFSVDTMKYQQTGHEDVLSVTSTLNPLTINASAQIGAIAPGRPFIYFSQRNSNDNHPFTVRVRRDITFHLTFSNLHVASMVNGIL